MLDFVGVEKYSAAKEELLKKVGEDDEIVLLIEKLRASTEEAFSKIDSCMPQQEALQSNISKFDSMPEPQQEAMRPLTIHETLAQSEQVAKEVINTPPLKHDAPQELDIEAMAQQEPLSDELICPRCQTGNPQDAIFCFACGTKLGVSTTKKTEPTMNVVRGEAKKEEKREELQAVAVIPREVRRKDKHGTEKAPNANNITVQKCPKCGMENLSIAAYCYHCNMALSGNEAGKQSAWLGRP